MRDAGCAKNMENAPKKYLAVKIAKNTKQRKRRMGRNEGFIETVI